MASSDDGTRPNLLNSQDSQATPLTAETEQAAQTVDVPDQSSPHRPSLRRGRFTISVQHAPSQEPLQPETAAVERIEQSPQPSTAAVNSTQSLSAAPEAPQSQVVASDPAQPRPLTDDQATQPLAPIPAQPASKSVRRGRFTVSTPGATPNNNFDDITNGNLGNADDTSTPATAPPQPKPDPAFLDLDMPQSLALPDNAAQASVDEVTQTQPDTRTSTEPPSVSKQPSHSTTTADQPIQPSSTSQPQPSPTANGSTTLSSSLPTGSVTTPEPSTTAFAASATSSPRRRKVTFHSTPDVAAIPHYDTPPDTWDFDAGSSDDNDSFDNVPAPPLSANTTDTPHDNDVPAPGPSAIVDSAQPTTRSISVTSSSLSAQAASHDHAIATSQDHVTATSQDHATAASHDHATATSRDADFSIRRPLEHQSSSLELAKSEHVQALASVFQPPTPASTVPASPNAQRPPPSPTGSRRPDRTASKASSRRVQFASFKPPPAAAHQDWEKDGLCSVQDGTYNLCVSTLRGGHRTQLAQAMMEDVKKRTNIAGSNRRKRLAKGKDQSKRRKGHVKQQNTARRKRDRTKLRSDLQDVVQRAPVPEDDGWHQYRYHTRSHVADSSLDYDVEPHKYRWGTTPFLLILGILAAFTDFAVESIGQLIIRARRQIVTSDLPFESQYVLWVVSSLLIATLAFTTTHYISSTAKGSGIPSLKVFLSGIAVKDYFSARTLIAKVVGLTLAIGSGLFVGKEGPFVHISAVIASLMTKHIPAFQGLRESVPLMQQLYSSAAAVGVSSSVRAPVGGLLFSVEVTSVSYEVENYWKGFFAASVGAVAVFLVTGQDFHFVDSDFAVNAFSRGELLAFAMMGVAGAFFGALFVRAQAYILSLRKRKKLHFLTMESPFFLDILGMLVAVATPLITFPLGDFARQPLVNTFQDLVTNSTLDGGDGIAADDWGSLGSVQLTLFLMGLLIYVLTFVSTTLTIPAGLFLPVMISGACWGRIVGEWMAIWFPELNVTPAGYAVVGAAAMGAGVTRTISTAVIVSEAVASVAFTVPVLLAVLLAVLIGNYLSLSVYDSMLSNSDAPYLPALNSDQAYHLTAGDVMDSLEPPDDADSASKAVVLPVLTRFSTLGALKQLLKHPFPRFNQLIVIINNEEDRLLLGSVNRKELSQAAQHLQIQLHHKYELGEQEEQRQERQQLHRHNLEHAGLNPDQPNNTDSAIALHDTSRQSPTTSATGSNGVRPRAQSTSFTPPTPARTRWWRLFNRASTSSLGATPESSPPRQSIYNTLMLQRNAKTVHDQDDMLIAHYQDPKQGKRVLGKVDKTPVDLFDLEGAYVNPAPFQCVRYTPVSEISYMLSMLHAQYAFVTDWGQLVGVVTKPGLAAGIINASERSRGAAPSTRRRDDNAGNDAASADAPSEFRLSDDEYNILDPDSATSQTSTWRKRARRSTQGSVASCSRTLSATRPSILGMDWHHPDGQSQDTSLPNDEPVTAKHSPQAQNRTHVNAPNGVATGSTHGPTTSSHSTDSTLVSRQENTSLPLPRPEARPARLSLQQRRRAEIPSLMELAAEGCDVPLNCTDGSSGSDVIVQVEAMDVVSEESDRVVTPKLENMSIDGINVTVSVV
eukprot:m.253614 g.253614  ORF g.253614 m.253614 type:complete len:1612 (+) comp17541_c0_seq3:233-5068(+)